MPGNNKQREQKHVDTRTTVQYYSMYQNLGDILRMTGMCFLIILFALLVMTIFYVLIISPNPSLNLFYMIEQVAQWFIKTVFAIVQWIAEKCVTW
jgi:hypothetical protein